MTLLPDSEAVYREWRRIVVQHGVLGVQAHDARLAAAMFVHDVSHILTLNATDFKTFQRSHCCAPGQCLSSKPGSFVTGEAVGVHPFSPVLRIARTRHRAPS